MDSFFETAEPRRGKYRRPRAKGIRRVYRVLRRLLWTFLVLSFLLAVGGALAVAGTYAYVIYEHGEALDRRYPQLAENSFVYDADGREIQVLEGERDRETVGPEALGENLPRAVVAIEDRRFYEHGGVDAEGIGRAAVADFRAQEVTQGGSTITEQLTKNLFIPEAERGEVSIWRRMRQAALAYAYERRHSKKEILTSYLNTVYFGDGAYGAEVAAERYFGKDARGLSLSEAATLAGFLHAPSKYPSETAKDAWRASERRDEVLEYMEEQGMISKPELRAAENEPVQFAAAPPEVDPAYKPFLDRVHREVEDVLGEDVTGRGGLKIYTTLEPETQRDAASSIAETLPLPDDPSGAVVSVEPRTGAIRAVAGQKGDFNLALDARRQPGSAFKPFVFAAALREYVSPQTTYESKDLVLNFGGQEYVIQNYDFIERGGISLQKALAESDNTVFVKLAMDLGLANVVDTAKALGVTSEVDPYPSTAIGGLGEGVSVLDMASAYATLDGGGVYREPYAVERVEKTGFGDVEPVYDHRIEGRRVMSTNQAAAATQALRGVVENGTASRFQNLDAELGRPSVGKTGTTDDFVDAWYVGYTPRLSTAVWVGYPEGRRPMRGVHGLPVVNGETLPLDLWARYMSRVTSGLPVVRFPKADTSEFKLLKRGYASGSAESGAEAETAGR